MQTTDDDNVIEYSDRTDYSAYAERCDRGHGDEDSVCVGFDKKELATMNFREFAEMVSHVWKLIRNYKPR